VGYSESKLMSGFYQRLFHTLVAGGLGHVMILAVMMR